MDGRTTALAARQFGLITRSQLLALGISAASVTDRVRSGRLIRVHAGVYAIAGAPASWERSVMAALLAAGAPSGAAGRTAARVWSLESLRLTDDLFLLVPYGRGLRLHGVHVRRSRTCVAGDIVKHGKFRVTTVERTLIDLAGELLFDALEDVVDEALRRKLTSVAKLQRRVALVGRGVPGIANLRKIIDARVGVVRPPGSGLESRFFRRLKRARMRLPVSQYELRDEDGRFVAFFDFAYPDIKLAIEIDGSGHLARKVRENDLVRQNKIVLEDWRILRFSQERVDCDPSVYAEIELALMRSVSGSARKPSRTTHRRPLEAAKPPRGR